MDPHELKPRQGKVLRFVVSRSHNNQVVSAEDCIVATKWSDLPKTKMQAVAALNGLYKLGLLTKDKQTYSASDAGVALLKQANTAGLWLKPPPPAITNPPTRSKTK